MNKKYMFSYLYEIKTTKKTLHIQRLIVCVWLLDWLVRSYCNFFFIVFIQHCDIQSAIIFIFVLLFLLLLLLVVVRCTRADESSEMC